MAACLDDDDARLDGLDRWFAATRQKEDEEQEARREPVVSAEPTWSCDRCGTVTVGAFAQFLVECRRKCGAGAENDSAAQDGQEEQEDEAMSQKQGS